MSNYEEEFNFGVECVKDAGKIIREAFNSAKKVTEKTGYNDLVTETDQLVEETLKTAISQKFPGSQFIGEETASEDGHCILTDSKTWVIDPIDGTTNFIHQNPQICTILAFLENKEVKFGLVYNPITQELWSAKRGKGAYYNGEKISVSKCSTLSRSLLVQEFYGSNPDKNQMMMKNMQTFLTKVSSFRCYGSAGLNLAYLAMGSVDIYFDCGLHVWDYAGPSLIVTEAGGVMCDINGGDLDIMARRMMAGASQELVDQCLPHINVVDMGRD